MTEEDAFHIVAYIDYDIAKEWQLDCPDRLMKVANKIVNYVTEMEDE